LTVQVVEFNAIASRQQTRRSGLPKRPIWAYLWQSVQAIATKLPQNSTAELRMPPMYPAAKIDQSI